MNLSTVKWAQWDKTQSRELLVCWGAKNPNFCRFADPKSTLWALPFPNAEKIRKSKTIRSICGYVRNKHGGSPTTHPRNRLSPWSLGMWGRAGKLWIDVTSAVWQLATCCLILRVGFRGQAIQWWHSWKWGSQGRCNWNHFGTTLAANGFCREMTTWGFHLNDGLLPVNPASVCRSLWIRSCSVRNCYRRATVRLGTE